MKSYAMRVLCACLLTLGLAACANTRDLKSQSASFDWSQAQKKVLIVQPDIVLSELTAGGMNEPRADWSKTARTSISSAIDQFMAKKGVTAVPLDEITDEHEIQLAKLHNAVGLSVMVHAMGPQKLPNKTTAMDWTLGPGASVLRDHYGTDYAMFVYLRDSYATEGRKAAIVGSILVCAVTSVCINVQGGQQVAFVSLVDLRSGNVVWFRLYGSESGDLREDKMAPPFVATLMKEFPL